eukprot:gb/GECG01011202.1/.p1 GENE.gb/GECG01011202.1/~~gb/GECG01011202.1/.p1  ORF type:complete len:346 (+),score=11.22 gb/GECG01011202.1/:1-1038(+)
MTTSYNSSEETNPGNTAGASVLWVYLVNWYQHRRFRQVSDGSEEFYIHLERLRDHRRSAGWDLWCTVKYWEDAAQVGRRDCWLRKLAWPGLVYQPLQTCALSTPWKEFPNFSGTVFIEPGSGRQATLTSLCDFPSGVSLLTLKRCGTLTDDAFSQLINLRALEMCGCVGSSITDLAFDHLSNLSLLKMVECNQTTISDSAFQRMSGLKSLELAGCEQSTITDSAFQHLSCLESFLIVGKENATISDLAFEHLSNSNSLRIGWAEVGFCEQSALSDCAFKHLSNLTLLDMTVCSQTLITSNAFTHLSSLEWLDMRGCDQPTLSDEAFRHLSQLVSLNMSGCSQVTK